jgi:hypothetical protein
LSKHALVFARCHPRRTVGAVIVRRWEDT